MPAVEALAVSASTYEGNPAIATYRAGLIGRAAAAFHVRRLVVFPDPDQLQAETMATLLRYQATAPYLRKRLFPMQEALRTAGELPPLQLPTHTVEAAPHRGELRQAVILEGGAEIGLDRLATVTGGPHLAVGDVVVVRVVQVMGSRVTVTPVGPEEPSSVEVTLAHDLRHAVTLLRNPVHASHTGDDVRKVHLPTPVSLVVGGREGLEGRPEVAGLPAVNLVPGQGTKTLRTDEAIWAGLATLRILP